MKGVHHQWLIARIDRLAGQLRDRGLVVTADRPTLTSAVRRAAVLKQRVVVAVDIDAVAEWKDRHARPALRPSSRTRSCRASAPRALPASAACAPWDAQG